MNRKAAAILFRYYSMEMKGRLWSAGNADRNEPGQCLIFSSRSHRNHAEFQHVHRIYDWDMDQEGKNKETMKPSSIRRLNVKWFPSITCNNLYGSY